MDPLLRQIIGRAALVIREMAFWMREVVRGCPRFEEEDFRSAAAELGCLLYRGRCRCGRVSCGGEHDLAAHPDSGLSLDRFVECAVAGPLGFDRNAVRANSIAQGMYYRLILNPECGMLVAPVELKRCHNPACAGLYEDMTCPGCGWPFTPEDTEVIAQHRLIIPGTYVAVLRWGCGGDAAGRHYYRQQSCREGVHGRQHDHCPWGRCPNRPPRHGERGTTLWVRRELVKESDAAGDPLLRPAIEEGMRQVLDGLDQDTRARLLTAFRNDPAVAGEAWDDSLAQAEWLFGGRQTVLTRAQLQKARQTLRRVLAEYGLDLGHTAGD
jgi:hypothetical protein